MAMFTTGDSVIYVAKHQTVASGKVGRVCKVLPSGTRYLVRFDERCLVMFETSLRKSQESSPYGCGGCGDF